MRNWKQEIYKRQKLIIYGLVTLCLFFANYKLFFKPTLASLWKTLPQVSRLQRKVDSARNAIANIPRYKEQIGSLRNRLSLYKKKFSTKQQISLLLKGLSETAESTGVKIITIKPHPVVTAAQQDASSSYQKFPISIMASCGYHQLGSFLNKLENAEAFMRVTDIGITSDSENPLEHQVYLLLNTYILNEIEDS